MRERLTGDDVGEVAIMTTDTGYVPLLNFRMVPIVEHIKANLVVIISHIIVSVIAKYSRKVKEFYRIDDEWQVCVFIRVHAGPTRVFT